MAVCGNVDHGRARYSRYSQVKPGTARSGTVLKRPIMGYIFEKQAFWGYQIWYWEVCLGHPLGHHEWHVWGIIWGMSGASSGACLGHIVNNGQQSTTIHGATCICDAFLAPTFLSRMSQKTQHMHFEDKILRNVCWWGQAASWASLV